MQRERDTFPKLSAKDIREICTYLEAHAIEVQRIEPREARRIRSISERALMDALRQRAN